MATSLNDGGLHSTGPFVREFNQHPAFDAAKERQVCLELLAYLRGRVSPGFSFRDETVVDDFLEKRGPRSTGREIARAVNRAAAKARRA